jgi:hypothetical protein
MRLQPITLRERGRMPSSWRLCSRSFPLRAPSTSWLRRINLDRLEELIRLAEELEPDRLEIAHNKYYGWALKNGSLLMPTEEQVVRSLPIVEAPKERLKGKIHLEAVFPDYFGSFLKACMGGWGAADDADRSVGAGTTVPLGCDKF